MTFERFNISKASRLTDTIHIIRWLHVDDELTRGAQVALCRSRCPQDSRVFLAHLCVRSVPLRSIQIRNWTQDCGVGVLQVCQIRTKKNRESNIPEILTLCTYRSSENIIDFKIVHAFISVSIVNFLNEDIVLIKSIFLIMYFWLYYYMNQFY